MEFFILQLVDFLTSIVACFYSAINISGKSVGVTRQWMVNHEDWIPNHTDDDDYHARFQDEVKQLNNLATTVWESYSEFARQSRRLLNL